MPPSYDTGSAIKEQSMEASIFGSSSYYFHMESQHKYRFQAGTTEHNLAEKGPYYALSKVLVI